MLGEQVPVLGCDSRFLHKCDFDNGSVRPGCYRLTKDDATRKRRDVDADGEREKSRRAGDADEEQIVTRIVTWTEVTLRSDHDNGSVRRRCYRLTKEDATRKLRACSRNAFSGKVPPRDTDTWTRTRWVMV